jgi:hypothetical protein
MILILKQERKPGVVIHACNPSTGGQRQEDSKVEASLDYIVRHCIKNHNQNQTKTHERKKANLLSYLELEQGIIYGKIFELILFSNLMPDGKNTLRNKISLILFLENPIVIGDIV